MLVTAQRTAAPHRVPFTVLAVIAAVTALILSTLDGRTIGLFHDDGLYAVVARSMAEGHGHRIISLPEEPWQTKYPPLYTAVLALAWRLGPEFPANVLWLKALNLLFIAAALLAAALWARTVLRPVSTVLFVALLGTSPGVVGFANFTMSDLPFLALVLGYLHLLGSQDNGGRNHTRSLAVAALSVAAVLTRSLGVALVVTSFIDSARRRQWRTLLLTSGVPFAAFVAWSVWAAWHREPGGPLLSYYVGYESSALTYLGSDPALARDIVLGNAALAVETLQYPIGQGWRALTPVYLVLAAFGVRKLLFRGQHAALIFAGVYLGLVLLHPFSPHRYLIAIVPILLLAILAGTEQVAGLLRPSRHSPTRRNAIVTVAAAGLLLPNLVGAVASRSLPRDVVRSAYVFSLGYEWKGFAECFEWIRRATPPSARLATMFDGTYFLYTGRQGIRPWVHQSHTYFYPYRRAQADVGDPQTVLAALERANVQYLILDPVAGWAEGTAARGMLRDLLRLPETQSELVFRSSNGLHEIYRLHAPQAASGQGRE